MEEMANNINKRPYELTKPPSILKKDIKGQEVEQQRVVESKENSNSSLNDEMVNNQNNHALPKIMDRKPHYNSYSPPKIHESVSSPQLNSAAAAPTKKSHSSSTSSTQSSTEKGSSPQLHHAESSQTVAANLQARQRRRQKLRISQNESANSSKHLLYFRFAFISFCNSFCNNI